MTVATKNNSKRIDFAFMEFQIRLHVFEDGTLSVDAEVEDKLTDTTYLYEDLIVRSTNVSLADIEYSIDIEQDKRYEAYAQDIYW